MKSIVLAAMTVLFAGPAFAAKGTGLPPTPRSMYKVKAASTAVGVSVRVRGPLVHFTVKPGLLTGTSITPHGEKMYGGVDVTVPPRSGSAPFYDDGYTGAFVATWGKTTADSLAAGLEDAKLGRMVKRDGNTITLDTRKFNKADFPTDN